MLRALLSLLLLTPSCFLSISEPNEGAAQGGTSAQGGAGGGDGGGGSAPERHFLYVVGGQIAGGTNSNGVFVATVDAAGALSWRSTAPLPEPSGIDYPAAIGLRGRLFVIGGTAGPNIDTVYWTDPDPDTGEINAWTQGPPIDGPRFRHAVAAAGDDLYVLAGKGDSGSFLDDVQRAAYDAALGVTPWTTLGPLPAPRHRFRAVGSPTHLYAIGGSSYDPTTMLEANASDTIFVGAITPRDVTWSTYTHPSFESRYNAAATIHGGRLYVTGGAFGSGASPRDDVAHAALGDDGMPGPFTTEIDGFGEPREAHGAVLAGDRLYIVGGLTAQGVTASCRVAALDGGPLAWSDAAPLPEARGFHGTAVLTAP